MTVIAQFGGRIFGWVGQGFQPVIAAPLGTPWISVARVPARRRCVSILACATSDKQSRGAGEERPSIICRRGRLLTQATGIDE